MLQSTAAVNHSHPVVVEWGKAYDSIIKFKESLITMLEEYQEKFPQLSNLIEELKAMDLHSLDRYCISYKDSSIRPVTDVHFLRC